MSIPDENHWLSPPSDLHLEAEVVHLWRCAEDTAASSVDKLASTLNSEETRRAEQYRSEPDRRRFVLSRGILRDLLGRYLDCPPESVRLSRDPRGKPVIDSTHHHESSLHFNLSHTTGMCVIGFAPSHAIGMNVEAVDPKRDWTPMARRFLHPREWEFISKLPVAERASAFYACWSCKEAYLKARGDGLARAPTSFEVVLPVESPLSRIVDPAAGAPKSWWLHPVELGPGFVAAAASEAVPVRTDCFDYAQDSASEPA
jgi:4'-phosphopantetheinyl transferase